MKKILLIVLTSISIALNGQLFEYNGCSLDTFQRYIDLDLWNDSSLTDVFTISQGVNLPANYRVYQIYGGIIPDTGSHYKLNDSIEMLKSIRILYISNVYIPLPKTIYKLDSLVYVEILGSIKEGDIPIELKDCKNLKLFCISSIQKTRIIPDGVVESKSLRFLIIDELVLNRKTIMALKKFADNPNSCKAIIDPRGMFKHFKIKKLRKYYKERGKEIEIQ